MKFPGPSKPDIELLVDFAPKEVWLRAEREAARSPMPNFKTGAVIFDIRTGKILSASCSYPHGKSNMATVNEHAETSALGLVRHLDLRRAAIAIYTLNKTHKGCAWSSAPCAHCAYNLSRRGVDHAVYAVRTDAGWQIRQDDLVLEDNPAVHERGKRSRQMMRA